MGTTSGVALHDEHTIDEDDEVWSLADDPEDEPPRWPDGQSDGV